MRQLPQRLYALATWTGALYAKGQYGKAEPLLLQSLQIYRKVLGAEHLDTATSLNNLVALHRAQGRDKETGASWAN